MVMQGNTLRTPVFGYIRQREIRRQFGVKEFRSVLAPRVRPSISLVVLCTRHISPLVFLTSPPSSRQSLGLPRLNLRLYPVKCQLHHAWGFAHVKHTCCRACMHPSTVCSWGCGMVSPSCVSLWPEGPQSGPCRLHRRSMHARGARYEHYQRIPLSACCLRVR